MYFFFFLNTVHFPEPKCIIIWASAAHLVRTISYIHDNAGAVLWLFTQRKSKESEKIRTVVFFAKRHSGFAGINKARIAHQSGRKWFANDSLVVSWGIIGRAAVQFARRRVGDARPLCAANTGSATTYYARGICKVENAYCTHGVSHGHSHRVWCEKFGLQNRMLNRIAIYPIFVFIFITY